MVASAAKPLVALGGVVGVVLAVIRRRQARADVELWREATSDTSR